MKLGKYKIVYENGITQTKYLIRHEDYEQVIKPTKDKIKELEETIDQLKRMLKKEFGSEYFTDQSPLFAAIKTGEITHENQGTTKLTITKL